MGCNIVTACASKTANRDAKETSAKYPKEDRCLVQSIIVLWILVKRQLGQTLGGCFA